MTAVVYLWDGEKVITHDKTLFVEDLRRLPYWDMPLLDTSWEMPGERYGVFDGFTQSWEPLSKEQLPAEFRTHLLLLGVA